MIFASVLLFLAAARAADSDTAPPPGVAENPGPLGSETPCGWLIRERDAGRAMTDLIALADAHYDLFNKQDLRCLKDADMHSRIIGAAKGDLAEERAGEEQEALDEAERLAEAEQEKVDAQRRAAEAEVRKARQAAALAESMKNRYDVDILSVLVGPGKQNGAPWDGMGSPNPSVVKAAVALTMGLGNAAAAPTAAVLEFMATKAAQGLEAPDVFGYAEFRGPHAPPLWAATRLSLRPQTAPADDQYYAIFSGSPGFRGIKIETGDVIRIVLYDADMTSSDGVGAMDLTASDIVRAVEAGGTVVLPVADRTANQVLLAQISVRPASTPLPGFSGTTFQK